MTDNPDHLPRPDEFPTGLDPLGDLLDGHTGPGWPVYLAGAAAVVLIVGFIAGVPVGMLLQGMRVAAGG